jgi:hypothetical protein
VTRPTAYRGQPLLVLVVLLAAWFALRVVLWQPPFPAPLVVAAEAAARLVAPVVNTVPDPAPKETPSRPVVPPARPPREPMWIEAPPPSETPELPPGWALAAEPTPAFAPVSPRIAGGHVLLAAAAFAQFEVAPELAALLARGRATPAAIPAFPQLAGDTARASSQRWSGDGWLLLRRDTTTPVTSGRGSYGRSQVGAVLRYRLAMSSGHRPAAYVRVSTALADANEPEVALGVTGRPIPGVPIALAVEGRVARLGGGSEARPAAYAYSEFPPLKLPLGARGEAYAQGGYVGGRFATAFVDGQVRIDREVVRLGPAELRAGGGAWGGAQKGAKRLDIGPGATIAVEVDQVPVRMSADWRFRVAGDANPSSGPALTISTGF